MHLNYKGFLYNVFKNRLYKYRDSNFAITYMLLYCFFQKKLLPTDRRRISSFLYTCFSGKSGSLKKKSFDSETNFFGKLFKNFLLKFIQKLFLVVLPRSPVLNSFLKGKKLYTTQVLLHSFLDLRLVFSLLNNIEVSLFFNSSVKSYYEFFLLSTELF